MTAPMTSSSQRAFIFDMDGTIVDNMAFHTKSWLAFFERRGHTLDPDAFSATRPAARAMKSCAPIWATT